MWRGFRLLSTLNLKQTNALYNNKLNILNCIQFRHYGKDSITGYNIHKHLLNNSVETPLNISNITSNDSNKLDKLINNFTQILNTLGLDLTDDSLKDTAKRVSKMYLNELFFGLDYNNFPICTKVKNNINYDSFIMSGDIVVQSTCEHHLVSISGKCNICYIPNNYIIGLSKLNRIVDFFSRRPQIQERLTLQIYYTLQYILETDDIIVVIKAEHDCIKCRGINDIMSHTLTNKIGGVFKSDYKLYNQFISNCKY